MAPITGEPLREHGRDWHVPCRMLQKRIADRKSCLGEIHHEGDVFLRHHRVLAEGPIDRQSVLFSDLLSVSPGWYRRSPRPLKNIAMADSQGPTRKLVLRAASIDGGCYSLLNLVGLPCQPTLPRRSRRQGLRARLCERLRPAAVCEP